MYEKLKELVASMEKDYEKFYIKGNKAAGTRLRVNLSKIKNIAFDMRKEIQEIKNGRN